MRVVELHHSTRQDGEWWTAGSRTEADRQDKLHRTDDCASRTFDAEDRALHVGPMPWLAAMHGALRSQKPATTESVSGSTVYRASHNGGVQTPEVDGSRGCE